MDHDGFPVENGRAPNRELVLVLQDHEEQIVTSEHQIVVAP